MKEYKNLKNLPEIKKFNNDHQELYNYIREHSGMKLAEKNIYEAGKLYDILLVEVKNYVTYVIYKLSILLYTQ